jgi:hypothetical protein
LFPQKIGEPLKEGHYPIVCLLDSCDPLSPVLLVVVEQFDVAGNYFDFIEHVVNQVAPILIREVGANAVHVLFEETHFSQAHGETGTKDWNPRRCCHSSNLPTTKDVDLGLPNDLGR